MLKQIENPDISNIQLSSQKLQELIYGEEGNKFLRKAAAPYSHWEKIKYWQTPPHVTPLELWKFIKLSRAMVPMRQTCPIKDESDCVFTWSMQPGFEELLHEIDIGLVDNFFASDNHSNDRMKDHLLIRGIMEEAIASSQLEGAHTSRRVAKQILLNQKKPKNKSEQMIVNNYQAMLLIESDLKEKKLSEAMLFDLHRLLTEKTLDPSDIGRYRSNEDNIVVSGHGAKHEVYHVPPKERFLRSAMREFIAYANNETPTSTFIHPVIKAIILHFWFGYLHPFVDGNGRMARALFYWFLLREKYWALSYLPLSRAIKSSPAQYRDAYVYTEQDDNDLNYFIDYNIRKLAQAVADFKEYAARKRKENVQLEKLARAQYSFNDRQIQLLRYYYKNKDVTTSAIACMRVYNTSRLTAMKDLKQLQENGFLTAKKVGKTVYYYATDKIALLFDKS
jgi:Fic family protein